MQGAILIYGANKQARKKYIDDLLTELNLFDTNKHSDLLIVNIEDKSSIGIDISKEIIKFTETKPFSGSFKAVVINDADKLTVQAQNALLKTLEEPPSYLSLVLNTDTESRLLDTVLSRCRRIRITESLSANAENLKYAFEDFIGFTISERLDYIEALCKEDRQVVIEVLGKWILDARAVGRFDLCEKFILVKTDLENTNLNLKLAIEYIAVS